MAVIPHPIVLSCRSWQSAQRTWVSSVRALSIWPAFKNSLYCHAELFGLVVSLCNQKGDIQDQSALTALRGTTRDSSLEELITPGVHLQKSDKLYVSF